MSLTDYSDLETEIKNAPEPKVLPSGSEVYARIISCRSGVSEKNDCAWHMPVFDVPDEPMVIEFNKFMWELDREKLDPKQFARALADFQKFAAAIGLDYSRPFSWEDDLVGKECWVILGIQKDDEYGDKNTIKRFVVRQ